MACLRNEEKHRWKRNIICYFGLFVIPVCPVFLYFRPFFLSFFLFFLFFFILLNHSFVILMGSNQLATRFVLAFQSNCLLHVFGSGLFRTKSAGFRWIQIPWRVWFQKTKNKKSEREIETKWEKMLSCGIFRRITEKKEIVACNDKEEGSERREELHCRREVLRGTCSMLSSDIGGWNSKKIARSERQAQLVILQKNHSEVDKLFFFLFSSRNNSIACRWTFRSYFKATFRTEKEKKKRGNKKHSNKIHQRFPNIFATIFS